MEINEFEYDIDVFVPKELIKDMCELADAFNLNYRILQATASVINICVTFEEDKTNELNEFITSIHQINYLFNKQQNEN